MENEKPFQMRLRPPGEETSLARYTTSTWFEIMLPYLKIVHGLEFQQIVDKHNTELYKNPSWSYYFQEYSITFVGSRNIAKAYDFVSLMRRSGYPCRYARESITLYQRDGKLLPFRPIGGCEIYHVSCLGVFLRPVGGYF